VLSALRSAKLLLYRALVPLSGFTSAAATLFEHLRTQKEYSMSIMREWRAEIRRALKDEYVAYVNATGIVGYLQTPGNLGAIIATP
jgi:hypothetical protein